MAGRGKAGHGAVRRGKVFYFFSIIHRRLSSVIYISQFGKIFIVKVVKG